MKITDREKNISANIDEALRTGDFQSAAYEDGVGYEFEFRGWYARLLTTLTLLLGEDTLVYSQTDYKSGAEEVQFALFTGAILVHVKVTDMKSVDAQVAVSAVARSGLQALEVSASLRSDEKTSRSDSWPGLVTIVARYASLSAPVVLRAPGQDRYTRDAPGPIVALLDGLKADLAR